MIDQVAFSDDGDMLATAGQDGFVRLWDVATGQPRPYLAQPPAGKIINMSFSPNGGRLAAVTGSRVWVADVSSGQTLTELEIGDALTDVVFVGEEKVYTGGRSGTLYVAEQDRAGHWNISSAWQGDAAIHHLEYAPRGHHLAVADAANRIHLLHAEDGSKGELLLELPEEIVDFRFSPAETGIVVKTLRWLHRATVTPNGFVPSGSLLAADNLPGSGIAFAVNAPGDLAAATGAVGNAHGDRVILLKRGSVSPAIEEFVFSFSTGPALIGEPEQLLERWREKLDIAE